MAQSANIAVQQRNQLGSRANKRLRDSGMLPGVVYGHKEAVVPVTLPKKEVVNYLNHGTHVFDLQFEGRSEKVLVKEVQYDHLGKEVIHVDFARVSLDERVSVNVPLEFRGTPKGEAEGGVLQQIISELQVECLVTEIPENIRVNVGDMAVDDVLHVRDLQLPPGVKALQDEDVIVATVKVIEEEEVAPAPDAAAAEPEVIGRKPDDQVAEAGEEKK